MREKNKCVREKWNVNIAVMVNMRDKLQLEGGKRESERKKGVTEENEGDQGSKRERESEGGAMEIVPYAYSAPGLLLWH